jgi:hypothetical protein
MPKPSRSAAKPSAKAPAARRGRTPAARPVPADVDPRFAAVIQAFARDPDVTAGVMMSAVGLKVGGKIFAMLPRGRFVAKLPKARVDALVAAGHGVAFDPGHGRVMKEWIELAGDEPSWLALAREARRFVGGA